MRTKKSSTQELGNRVKAVRLHLNLMQKDFADSLGVSAPTLSDVEKGKFKPSIELLTNMCQKYEVNLYYILLGDDSMFLSPVKRKWGCANEFAVNVGEVRDFLYYFENSKILQYRVLALFGDLMNREKDMIISDLKNIQKEEE